MQKKGRYLPSIMVVVSTVGEWGGCNTNETSADGVLLKMNHMPLMNSPAGGEAGESDKSTKSPVPE